MHNQMENETTKSLLNGRDFPDNFHDETTTEIKVGNRTIQLIERINKVFLMFVVLYLIFYLLTLTEPGFPLGNRQ